MFAHLKTRVTTVEGGLLNLSVTMHSFQERKHWHTPLKWKELEVPPLIIVHNPRFHGMTW